MLVDRWSRHRVLVVTQVLSMIQSALLAVLALTSTITIAHLLVLVAFQGIINAFDTPARQSFVVEMVDRREDLPNAIALNSTMVNAARLIGPSIAGILISVMGEGYCFAADAVSYVAVIGSLLAMRVAPKPIRPKSKRVLAELADGFRYVRASVRIRSLLMLLALVSLVGVPYTVLMPVFVAKVFHGGPHTLGWLMAAQGAGAVTGALWLASRQQVAGLGKILVIACAAFGVGLVAFGFSRSLWISLPLLLVTGAGMMIQMAASNTLLQTLVDDDKRGRVMSFYTMAFFGMVPFGSLIAGFLTDRIGAPYTVVCGGVVTMLASAWFSRILAKLRAARPPPVAAPVPPDVAE